MQEQRMSDSMIFRPSQVAGRHQEDRLMALFNYVRVCLRHNIFVVLGARNLSFCLAGRKKFPRRSCFAVFVGVQPDATAIIGETKPRNPKNTQAPTPLQSRFAHRNRRVGLSRKTERP